MKFRSFALSSCLVSLLLSLSSGCVSETPADDDDDNRESESGAGGGGIDQGTGGGFGAGGLGSGGGFGVGGSGAGGLGSGGFGTGGDGAGGFGSGGQGTGGGAVVGSEGCGMTVGQSTGTWNNGLASGVGDRNYDVWLPNNYDPMRAYPVILLLHGCSSATNNVPMETQVGEDSIVIRGAGTDGTCWFAGANQADMPYVDAIIERVQENFCVNPDHLFAVGYSSGSWLASSLSCHRGDVFRGIATVTGGEPSGISNCSGQVGRIYIHDSNDTDNLVAWDEPSRNRQIQTNNCSNNSSPVDPSPCVEYQDCDPGYPVVWCQTSGQGHSRQDSFAKSTFWNFFQRLMAE